MDKDEAKALAARLLAAFPGRAVAEGTAALYVEYLLRYPSEVGANAVRRLIEGSRWLPAVSELHEELIEENESYQGFQRLALAPGQKPPKMTDEEIREAMAPVRDYLGKRGIGQAPEDIDDEAREREIAEKRERVRTLPTGDAA